MSARAGVKLKQFGYDQFGVGRAVTVPETGAVADDYILGPGDEIRCFAARPGKQRFPHHGGPRRQCRAAAPGADRGIGRTFGSFRQDVDAAVHRAYVASTASISIGRVRQISVLVAGEVNIPGPRLVTGLSSALDALLLSGGMKKTGSLRNIRLQRGGRIYSRRSLRRADRQRRRRQHASGRWRPYHRAAAGPHRGGGRPGAPSRHL